MNDRDRLLVALAAVYAPRAAAALLGRVAVASNEETPGPSQAPPVDRLPVAAAEAAAAARPERLAALAQALPPPLPAPLDGFAAGERSRTRAALAALAADEVGSGWPGARHLRRLLLRVQVGADARRTAPVRGAAPTAPPSPSRAGGGVRHDP